MHEVDSSQLTPAEGRRFAWSLGAVSALFAILAGLRGRERAAVVFAMVSSIIFLAGLTVPSRLGPIERAWMGFARAISRVTTPLVLGIIYFLVLTPIGLLRRAVTKRTLSPSRSTRTFWVDRKPTEPAVARRRMERQF